MIMYFKSSHLLANMKEVQGYIGTMVTKYFPFNILLSNIVSNMLYSTKFYIISFAIYS